MPMNFQFEIYSPKEELKLCTDSEFLLDKSLFLGKGATPHEKLYIVCQHKPLVHAQKDL